MADAPVSFDQIEDVSQAPSFDSIEDAGQASGSNETLAAGAEGAAEGVLGPAALYAEKKIGVDTEENILRRRQEHPIAHGVGQALGLVGSSLTGAGEGAIMAKAGEAAATATGLAEGTSLSAKIGSSAVKQAAEMAVLQSGDEISKNVLNDPDYSAESALTNIGLATAFGAGGGAMMGSLSPLWKATVGTKVEQVLGGLKDHLDGVARLNMPEDVEKAAQTLNISLPLELRAGLSGDPKAANILNELREVQHPTIVAGLQNLERSVNDSVLQSIGRSPEEIANYSEAEGGKQAMETFKKEYNAKYSPIAKEFESITKPFEDAQVTSSHIATLSDKIAQIAQEKGYLGADIPQNKIVNSVLNRLPEVKTVQDFSKLSTQLRNMTSGDFALTGVRRDIQGLLQEAQHNALGYNIGKDAPEMMGRYMAARSAYADLAKISEQVGSDLGLGKFVGPKTLLDRVVEKRSPEEFLRRLSPKGNAEILGFLGQHFPDTMESIRDNELKQLIKPAVLGAKGDQVLNSKILNNAIERGMAGQPERIKFALPNGALERIQAARTIQDAIPGMKSSGTAGWQQKMMAHVPQSALAGIAMVTGHNPIFGYLGGHLGKLLARDVPDAMKLSLLRFMSSDQPIKAEGFKAMVEFLSNTAKGQTLLTKSAGNVFKSGAQVLTDSQMPNKADREKLNNVVEKLDKSPEMLMRLTNSNVGHYLSPHQASLSESSTRAMQYLQSIKPRPYQSSPLDKPIEPSKDQMARYNRALDIANQPALVLHHVKQGTLQINDMKDLNSMYPALMKQMQQKVANAMTTRHSEDHLIPYKTKMGVSLFLGQPVDSTMTPQSIMSAQPRPSAPPPQQAPKKGSTKELGKSNKGYMTPDQASESRRSEKD